MATKKKYKVAVIDFETDPFLHGRVPSPFCVEFYTDGECAQFWGDDCADQLLEYLEELPDNYLIYAHNGGKFDFHFLHKSIDNPALIIKTRIVEAKLFHHKVRDSYAILPVPLRDYSKMDFDYDKMERHCREKYKDEILVYLHDDCVKLYELVSAFIDKFGNRMTIGGTAIREIEKFHPFTKNGSKHDEVFRQFYYGGRVQCFENGILPGPWKLVDVNSMYPKAMRDYRHPINGSWDISNEFPDDFTRPFFMIWEGRNFNALPSKDELGGLIFTKQDGLFYSCSHELEIALKYNLIEIDTIHKVYLSTESISFREFVDTYYKEKADCKEKGDKTGEIFAKLLLNSGYGRMGINPANFEDWIINRDFGNDDEMLDDGYALQVDYEDFELWSRPAEISESQYCDVAIAASITSAARAILLQGLQQANRPVYCDTDSIICRDFSGDMDKLRLGAWDLEKVSDNVAIAGKKMYALYNNDMELKKLSSKGGTLSLDEIIRICNGETVTYKNMAPTFSLKRPPMFVTRNFRKTAQTDETDENEFSEITA